MDLIAKTAEEQLRRWDSGESIWSIEMGGLGPGYEQAIQVLAVEILRDEIGKPLPGEKAKEWAYSTVDRVNKDCGGFSGAQVGAARQLAFGWLRDGPAQVCASVPNDRHIQVSNFWPLVKK